MNQGAAQTTLSDRTSRSAVWATTQAILMRVSGLATQLILARILLRDDFGIYALSTTVFTLVGTIHQGGVQDVLIKRQKAFHLWANAAFWLVLAMGLASCLLTILAAPMVARFYKTPRPDELVWLIRVLAMAFPLTAAGAVCRAKIHIDMRFKQLAGIGTLCALFDGAVKIVLAMCGYGAMSFAYGTVCTAAVWLILCWAYSPFPIKLDLQFRRWRFLIGDGMMVVFAMFFNQLIEEGDYIVLGRFATPEATIGIYYFAFKIARHSMAVVTHQLAKVLFPALASVPSGRRIDAFIGAARFLSVVSLFVCFLTAIVADPLIRILCKPVWYASIPLVQIMCVGMALRTLSWPSISLLGAQGRFRTRLVLSVLAVLAFFPSAILGTWLNSTTGLAIALALFHSGMAIAELTTALWLSGEPFRGIAKILGIQMWANMFSIVPTLAITYGLVPLVGLPHPWEAVLQIVVSVVIAIPLYAIVLRRLDAQLWESLLARAARTFSRKKVEPAP